VVQVQRLEDQNLALALQLETATGRPASDWGSIPATPSGLSLPNQASAHCQGVFLFWSHLVALDAFTQGLSGVWMYS